MFRDNPNIRVKTPPPPPPLVVKEEKPTTFGLVDFLELCGNGAIELSTLDFAKNKTLDEMVTLRTMAWFHKCAQKIKPPAALDDLVKDPKFGMFVRSEHVDTINAFLELCGDSVTTIRKPAAPTDDITLKDMVTGGTYVTLTRHAIRLGRTENGLIDIIRDPEECGHFARFAKLSKRYETITHAAFPSGGNSLGTMNYVFSPGLRDKAQTAKDLKDIEAFFERKKSINVYE